MCVGLLPAERVTRARATGDRQPARPLRRDAPAATGSAAPRCSRARSWARTLPTSARPCRSATRSRGKKLIEVSLELVEARARRVAAGLRRRRARLVARRDGPRRRRRRRPPRPRPAARGRDGAVGDHDLRSRRSGWSRSSRPQLLDAVRGVCATLGARPARAIGDVTDTRRAARVLRRRGRSARSRPRSSPTSARATRSSRRRGPASPATPPSTPDNYEPKAWIYEQYDQLVGSRTVRRPGLDAAVLRLRPSLRGLAVSLDGPPLGERDPFRAGALAVLGRGAQRRLRRRRAARAHRLPQLRQSGEAGDRLGAGGRRSRASRRLPRRSAFRSSPATSRSTTRPTAGRSRRRRSSAASASCATCARCRARWRARRRRRSWLADGRRARARLREARCRLAGRRPVLSLAHDVMPTAASSRRSPRRAAFERSPSVDLPRAMRPTVAVACVAATRRSDSDWPHLRELGDGRLMCGVFGIRAPGRDVARVHLLRPLRAPAPRPGVGGDRGLRRRSADGAARHGPRHAGLRRAEAAAASTATSRSGTRATRPPARRSGRTRSRCFSTGAAAPSRSATTATSSTRPSCARSSRPRASP